MQLFLGEPKNNNITPLIIKLLINSHNYGHAGMLGIAGGNVYSFLISFLLSTHPGDFQGHVYKTSIFCKTQIKCQLWKFSV